MSTMKEPGFDFDRLSHEIFSILEANFLFGSGGGTMAKTPGRVRILSIDGGSRASDAVLAALALSNLESSLQRRSGDHPARISDYFDAAAGSGAGGVLAAMLFTRGTDGRPLFTAADALRFLVKHRSKLGLNPRRGTLTGIFHGGRASGRLFRRIFGESTLRGTIKPLLVPCYDLTSASPLLFSRADAVGIDSHSHDFRMWEVCAATCASAPFHLKSVDGRTPISAVGGGVAMGNPTAAAITHVLNNKQDFPLAAGVEDLLVLSIAAGDSAAPPAAELVRLVCENSADLVDQAVALSFGQRGETNYFRIKGHGEYWRSCPRTPKDGSSLVELAEKVLEEKNVGSVLLGGKKMREETNAERLEILANELVKEQIQRNTATATSSENQTCIVSNDLGGSM